MKLTLQLTEEELVLMIESLDWVRQRSEETDSLTIPATLQIVISKLTAAAGEAL